jgi:hypothetical protein
LTPREREDNQYDAIPARAEVAVPDLAPYISSAPFPSTSFAVLSDNSRR